MDMQSSSCASVLQHTVSLERHSTHDATIVEQRLLLRVLETGSLEDMHHRAGHRVAARISRVKMRSCFDLQVQENSSALAFSTGREMPSIATRVDAQVLVCPNRICTLLAWQSCKVNEHLAACCFVFTSLMTCVCVLPLGNTDWWMNSNCRTGSIGTSAYTLVIPIFVAAELAVRERTRES